MTYILPEDLINKIRERTPKAWRILSSSDIPESIKRELQEIVGRREISIRYFFLLSIIYEGKYINDANGLEILKSMASAESDEQAIFAYFLLSQEQYEKRENIASLIRTVCNSKEVLTECLKKDIPEDIRKQLVSLSNTFSYGYVCLLMLLSEDLDLKEKDKLEILRTIAFGKTGMQALLAYNILHDPSFSHKKNRIDFIKVVCEAEDCSVNCLERLLTDPNDINREGILEIARIISKAKCKSQAELAYSLRLCSSRLPLTLKAVDLATVLDEASIRLLLTKNVADLKMAEFASSPQYEIGTLESASVIETPGEVATNYRLVLVPKKVIED